MDAKLTHRKNNQINENIAGGITLPFAFFNGKTKIQTFGR